jgi:hypothetical protein
MTGYRRSRDIYGSDRCDRHSFLIEMIYICQNHRMLCYRKKYSNAKKNIFKKTYIILKILVHNTYKYTGFSLELKYGLPIEPKSLVVLHHLLSPIQYMITPGGHIPQGSEDLGCLAQRRKEG